MKYKDDFKDMKRFAKDHKLLDEAIDKAAKVYNNFREYLIVYQDDYENICVLDDLGKR